MKRQLYVNCFGTARTLGQRRESDTLDIHLG